MTAVEGTLLKLLRLALGTDDGTPLYDITEQEWRRLIDASYDHGLPSVAIDGLHLAMSANSAMELTIDSDTMEDDKYDWLGGVFFDEEDNRKFSAKLDKLCGMFTEHGLRPVLLKGLGLGFDYPIPEHRPVGDIDLFLLEGAADGVGGGAAAGAGAVGAARRGDLLMRQVLGIEVTKTRFGRHSHAAYRGIPIENHYALGSPDSGRKKDIRLDERMRELIAADLRPAPLYYLPSADFNAVFLMWHLGSHLCYDRLLLRQLCDYMMFLRAHNTEIHWDLVREIWRDADLERFAVIINSILIKYLGMPAEYVPDWARHSGAAAASPAGPAAAHHSASTSPRHSGLDPESEMVDRVMAEILSCNKRSFKFVSNVTHYFTDAWKYKLVGGQHWLPRLVGSAWQHIACRAERKELPVC